MTYFDQLVGALDTTGIHTDSIVVVSYSVYYKDSGYTLDELYAIDSGNVIAGSYEISEGFHTTHFFGNHSGCYGYDTSEPTDITSDLFLLSFTHHSFGRYTVLVYDTTRGYTDLDIDGNTIDSVLLGNLEIFGEPETIRTIPPINIPKWSLPNKGLELTHSHLRGF